MLHPPTCCLGALDMTTLTGSRRHRPPLINRSEQCWTS